MKHTPGPWTIDASRVRTAVNAGNKHIAMVNYFQSPDVASMITIEEHEANARLIAAVPDLYDALIHMRIAAHALNSLHNDSEPDDVEQAQELYQRALRMTGSSLAKAKGE